jgi:hypothetical protein
MRGDHAVTARHPERAEADRRLAGSGRVPASGRASSIVFSGTRRSRPMSVTAPVIASDTQTPRGPAARSLGAPPMPRPLTSREALSRCRIVLRSGGAPRRRPRDRDLARPLAHRDGISHQLVGIDDGDRVAGHDRGRRPRPGAGCWPAAAATPRSHDRRDVSLRLRRGSPVRRSAGTSSAGILGQDALLELTRPGQPGRALPRGSSGCPSTPRARRPDVQPGRARDISPATARGTDAAHEAVELGDKLRMATEARSASMRSRSPRGGAPRDRRSRVAQNGSSATSASGGPRQSAEHPQRRRRVRRWLLARRTPAVRTRRDRRSRARRQHVSRRLVRWRRRRAPCSLETYT